MTNQDRNARQERISAWAQAAFGVDQATSLPQRGLRLLEEAAEAFQATGGSHRMARHLVDFVFARPVGHVGQELGGVAVCVLALAAAAGLSAEEEERREVDRVLSKPIEEFAKRNSTKNAAGLLASAPRWDDAVPERCPECTWSNTELLNYGSPQIGQLWLCHGCAARRLQGTPEDLARERRFNADLKKANDELAAALDATRSASAQPDVQSAVLELRHELDRVRPTRTEVAAMRSMIEFGERTRAGSHIADFLRRVTDGGITPNHDAVAARDSHRDALGKIAELLCVDLEDDKIVARVRSVVDELVEMANLCAQRLSERDGMLDAVRKLFAADWPPGTIAAAQAQCAWLRKTLDEVIATAERLGQNLNPDWVLARLRAGLNNGAPGKADPHEVIDYRPATAILDIVFDGPPGPEAGRFVEVEDSTGRSVSVGEWIDRGDGLWALRLEHTAGMAHKLRMSRRRWVEAATAALGDGWHGDAGQARAACTALREVVAGVQKEAEAISEEGRVDGTAEWVAKRLKRALAGVTDDLDTADVAP